jgi:hypothetical protein
LEAAAMEAAADLEALEAVALEVAELAEAGKQLSSYNLIYYKPW